MGAQGSDEFLDRTSFGTVRSSGTCSAHAHHRATHHTQAHVAFHPLRVPGTRLRTTTLYARLQTVVNVKFVLIYVKYVIKMCLKRLCSTNEKRACNKKGMSVREIKVKRREFVSYEEKKSE